MARKQKSNPSTQKQLSLDEMASAVKKIDKRLADLKRFDLESIDSGFDPKVVTFEHKIDQLLLDVFGDDSAQYDRYWDIAFVSLLAKLVDKAAT